MTKLISGDGFWKLILMGAALLVALSVIGPSGRSHLMAGFSGFGTDPMGTIQFIGSRLGLVLLGIGALLHFTPWTRTHGAAIVEGVILGLGLIFVGLPVLGWVLTHRAEIGAFFASLGIG